MKNILLAVVMFLCLHSCEKREDQEPVSNKYQSNGHVKLGENTYEYIKKIEFEGHSYLIYGGIPHVSGFTHDMNCECLKK